MAMPPKAVSSAAENKLRRAQEASQAMKEYEVERLAIRTKNRSVAGGTPCTRGCKSAYQKGAVNTGFRSLQTWPDLAEKDFT